MTVHNVVGAVLVAGLAWAGLSACEKQGLAEKAGKAIDQTAPDISDRAKGAVRERFV
jgi:hypothetical protein